MAEHLFYVGSHGPYYYDDTDTYDSTGDPLDGYPMAAVATDGGITALGAVNAYDRDIFRYMFMMTSGY
jgi:hypothetical protein